MYFQGHEDVWRPLWYLITGICFDELNHDTLYACGADGILKAIDLGSHEDEILYGSSWTHDDE